MWNLKKIVKSWPFWQSPLKEWLCIDPDSYRMHMDFGTQSEAEQYSGGRYIIVQVNRVILPSGETYFFKSVR